MPHAVFKKERIFPNSNKQFDEVIRRIVSDTNLSEAFVCKTLESFIENVQEVTFEVGKVKVPKLGTFRMKYAQEKRNPAGIGGLVKLPPRYIAKFEPDENFRSYAKKCLGHFKKLK